MVWSADEFSLVITVDGFRQRIIETVPDGSDGRNSADLGEALGEECGFDVFAVSFVCAFWRA